MDRLGHWNEDQPLTLPGGLSQHGRLERYAVLRPLTGEIEQACYEQLATAASGNWPRAVSEVLGRVVDRVGGEPADAELAARLCTADRQYLLLRLAQQFRGDTVWVRPTCTACGAPFDVGLSRADLPVKPAGEGFPFARITLRGLGLTARVPNGADQEAIADAEPDAAVRELLRRCLATADGARPSETFVTSLSDEDIGVVEERLDAVAPDVGTRLASACPECGADQVVTLEPFPADGGDFGGMGLYADVHVLALYYHWTEPAILALPRTRRRLYLNLIDRSRGVFA